MKKFYPTYPTVAALVLSVVCPSVISAKHISAEEALNRVKNVSQLKHLAPITRSATELSAVIGNLYVFNSPEGYMILPADDKAPAVLAYSDDNSFSVNDNPALSYWLNFYNQELDHLSEDQASNAVALSGASTRAESVRKEREPIAPLTKTKWNQEAPYNDLCPKINGHETVTGCVATAMAQVLKYHSYPAKGRGEHSYHWAPGNETLSFDYGATTFEWDLMTDTYDEHSTEEAKKAVATLMLACGISVNMHYDIGDSGAASMTMGASLIDYFSYDNGIWMPIRDYYGLYEWEEMIYADLAKGLPVLYSGNGTAGGHQFICDGYSSDGFFHFNWGWGGMSNGYFLLTALNPADLGVGGGAGGFNSGQQIALGVKPAKANSEHTYLMYCTNHFISESHEVTEGQELRFKGGFFNYSLSSLPEDSKLGVKIKKVDDNEVKFEESYGISDLPPLRGYEEDVIRFPELTDGEYILSPAFFDGKHWIDIPTPIGSIGSCHAIVSDHTATLSNPAAATVSVTEIKVPEVIYKGREFPLEFTIENKSDVEFLGKVTPVLVDPTTDEAIASSQYRPVDVEADSRIRVTDYIGDFSALKGEDLEPGEYLLLFHDSEGKPISDSVKVKVEPTPEATTIKVTGFQVDEEEPVRDKSAVKFTFAVTCEEGYFTGHLHIYIFPGDGGNDLAGANSEMMYITAGEKHYGAIVMDLSTLDNGEYIAIIYHDGHAVTDQIRFRLADDTTAVSVIGNDSKDSKQIIDLNGIYHTEPLRPGIYIINGVKTVVR